MQVIVSASRRTDIPAFYSKWFINRVRQGWCLVPNPFNRLQVSRVSLSAGDVDAYVFWTRNPRPLMRYLAELDGLGCRYYFLITLIGYPERIDPGAPSFKTAVNTFQDLSARIGPNRVIWRYDPVLLSSAAGCAFHKENFGQAARALRGCTKRCIISFMKPYRKARARIEAAAPGSSQPVDSGSPEVRDLLTFFSETARENSLEVFSCAGETDLSPLGVKPSKCIDGELISTLFDIEINAPKDSCQRKECGCTASKDIGAYDTCLFGCSYCYATSSLDRAKANHARHDPNSPSLI
ncbi:MAG: DUF1848 domain-containing protein [Syntrophobacteraceae bacterium]